MSAEYPSPKIEATYIGETLRALPPMIVGIIFRERYEVADYSELELSVQVSDNFIDTIRIDYAGWDGLRWIEISRDRNYDYEIRRVQSGNGIIETSWFSVSQERDWGMTFILDMFIGYTIRLTHEDTIRGKSKASENFLDLVLKVSFPEGFDKNKVLVSYWTNPFNGFLEFRFSYPGLKDRFISIDYIHEYFRIIEEGSDPELYIMVGNFRGISLVQTNLIHSGAIPLVD